MSFSSCIKSTEDQKFLLREVPSVGVVDRVYAAAYAIFIKAEFFIRDAGRFLQERAPFLRRVSTRPASPIQLSFSGLYYLTLLYTGTKNLVQKARNEEESSLTKEKKQELVKALENSILKSWQEEAFFTKLQEASTDFVDNFIARLQETKLASPDDKEKLIQFFLQDANFDDYRSFFERWEQQFYSQEWERTKENYQSGKKLSKFLNKHLGDATALYVLKVANSVPEKHQKEFLEIIVPKLKGNEESFFASVVKFAQNKKGDSQECGEFLSAILEVSHLLTGCIQSQNTSEKIAEKLLLLFCSQQEQLNKFLQFLNEGSFTELAKEKRDVSEILVYVFLCSELKDKFQKHYSFFAKRILDENKSHFAIGPDCIQTAITKVEEFKTIATLIEETDIKKFLEEPKNPAIDRSLSIEDLRTVCEYVNSTGGNNAEKKELFTKLLRVVQKIRGFPVSELLYLVETLQDNGLNDSELMSFIQDVCGPLSFFSEASLFLKRHKEEEDHLIPYLVSLIREYQTVQSPLVQMRFFSLKLGNCSRFLKSFEKVFSRLYADETTENFKGFLIKELQKDSQAVLAALDKLKALKDMWIDLSNFISLVKNNLQGFSTLKITEYLGRFWENRPFQKEEDYWEIITSLAGLYPDKEGSYQEWSFYQSLESVLEQNEKGPLTKDQIVSLIGSTKLVLEKAAEKGSKDTKDWIYFYTKVRESLGKEDAGEKIFSNFCSLIEKMPLKLASAFFDLAGEKAFVPGNSIGKYWIQKGFSLWRDKLENKKDFQFFLEKVDSLPEFSTPFLSEYVQKELYKLTERYVEETKKEEEKKILEELQQKIEKWNFLEGVLTKSNGYKQFVSATEIVSDFQRTKNPEAINKELYFFFFSQFTRFKYSSDIETVFKVYQENLQTLCELGNNLAGNQEEDLFSFILSCVTLQKASSEKENTKIAAKLRNFLWACSEITKNKGSLIKGDLSLLKMVLFGLKEHLDSMEKLNEGLFNNFDYIFTVLVKKLASFYETSPFEEKCRSSLPTLFILKESLTLFSGEPTEFYNFLQEECFGQIKTTSDIHFLATFMNEIKKIFPRGLPDDEVLPFESFFQNAVLYKSQEDKRYLIQDVFTLVQQENPKEGEQNIKITMRKLNSLLQDLKEFSDEERLYLVGSELSLDWEEGNGYLLEIAVGDKKEFISIKKVLRDFLQPQQVVQPMVEPVGNVDYRRGEDVHKRDEKISQALTALRKSQAEQDVESACKRAETYIKGELEKKGSPWFINKGKIKAALWNETGDYTDPFYGLLAKDKENFSVYGNKTTGREILGRCWLVWERQNEEDKLSLERGFISALTTSFENEKLVCNQGKTTRLFSALQGYHEAISIDPEAQLVRRLFTGNRIKRKPTPRLNPAPIAETEIVKRFYYNPERQKITDYNHILQELVNFLMENPEAFFRGDVAKVTEQIHDTASYFYDKGEEPIF